MSREAKKLIAFVCGFSDQQINKLILLLILNPKNCVNFLGQGEKLYATPNEYYYCKHLF